MGNNDVQFTYDKFNFAIEHILKEIDKVEYKPQMIYGVTRGGLIPAVVISHKLGVPLRTITCQRYEEHTFEIDPNLISYAVAHRVLVVDDIADSGETIKVLREKLPLAMFATLIYNSDQAIGIPDFTAYIVKRNTDKRWIKFWWEKTNA